MTLGTLRLPKRYSGVPFHPEGEKPRAPCPLCMLEKGDATPKVLYGVISQAEDEHDSDIPKDFFQTPPAKLGGQSAASAALRVSFRFSPYTLA